ncbi:MAG: Flp family type IVb pilin [Actinomycetota bacterium]
MLTIRSLRMLGPWVVGRCNLRSERAAAAVEYAIMLVFIAVVIILGVVALGNRAESTFDCTATSIGDKGATKC